MYYIKGLSAGAPGLMLLIASGKQGLLFSNCESLRGIWKIYDYLSTYWKIHYLKRLLPIIFIRVLLISAVWSNLRKRMVM